MNDPTATVRALLALRAEVDKLQELLDAKSHEAGLYARRMEQAQRSRDEARAEERAAVVAWLRGEPERLVACDGHRHADGKPCFVLSPMPVDELADAIERGEHRREGEP